MQRELCKIEENRGKLTNCWYICHQMKNDRWPNTPPSPSPPLYTLLQQFTNVHLFLAKLLKWKVWKMSLKLAIFHLILWFRVDCGVLELHTQTHINIHQHTPTHTSTHTTTKIHTFSVFLAWIFHPKVDVGKAKYTDKGKWGKRTFGKTPVLHDREKSGKLCYKVKVKQRIPQIPLQNKLPLKSNFTRKYVNRK